MIWDVTHSLWRPCSFIFFISSGLPLCTRTLHWRHNDHGGVSKHQPHGYLLNRLFRRRSKKTSKLRVTGLGAGNSPGPVNSPHKGPVTQKMFPFDDVIMTQMVSDEVTEQHEGSEFKARIINHKGYNYSSMPLTAVEVNVSMSHYMQCFIWCNYLSMS